MYQDLLSGDDQEIVDSTVDKHLNVKMKMCSKRRKDIVEPIKFNQILKHNSVCEICQQDVGASIENIPTIPRSSDPIPTEDAQLRNSKSAPSLPLIKTKYNTKSSGSSNKNAKDSGSNAHSRKTSLKTMKAEGLGSATSLPSILSKYKHIGKRFDTNSISLADSYLKTIRDANKFSADTHNNIAERGFDATEATVPPNNLRKQTKTRIKRLTVAECSYCSVVAHIHCLPKSIADSIFNSMNVESDLDANQGSTRSNFGYEWTCDSCIESQQHSLRYLQKKLDLEELKAS